MRAPSCSFVRSSTRRLPVASILLLAATTVLRPATATTAILADDEALVRQAPVIVVARCEGRLPATSEETVTDWLFTVERELKGTTGSGSFELRVPEGESVTGARSRLFGAPRFRTGSRALLFLTSISPGRYRVVHLFQGAFHVVAVDGRSVAVRDLSEVDLAESGRRSRRDEAVRARDFDAFVGWIEDRQAGLESPPDYRIRLSRAGVRALRQAFTLLEGNGINYRWFEFDTGGSVPMRTNGSQVGLPGGGTAEFVRALAAWRNDPATPVNLTHVGTTSASAGLRTADGENTLLFNDPNEELEDLDCVGGGVLAAANVRCAPCTTGTFRGTSYWRVREADIVVNDGMECTLGRARNPSKYVERLLAHEAGHNLGIGHSSENENEPKARLRNAVMFFQLPYSASSSSPNEDDLAALAALYRSTTGPPPSPGSCPQNALCLLRGRFRITATWRNQFDGSSGSAGTQKESDVAGYLYFTDPRNTELIFKILDFGTVVKVFWGQLTNLQYTITVTDTRDGTSKQYSNTPGDCGGFDDNGFPASSFVLSGRRLTATIRRASLAGTCRADADTLCLIGNRFAVEMTWRNQFDNTSGVGRPKRLSDLTGAFAFTDPSNLEILIKTLPFPDRVLVLYGALSNLEYTLRVTDTVTGSIKTYSNPAGRYCGGLDNNAFPP